MLIDYLCAKGQGPVLVVDADANANLNEVLGVEAQTSLGEIREEMAQAELKGSIPAGMTKADYADFKFSSAIIEEDDFDMLIMGRTQGKGCYCYVNGVLKTQVDKYAKNYKYIVMDNEAGLEHVARGTLPKVDTMLLISDCSRRGIQAVARIAEMVKEMELKPGRMGLIVNRAPGGQLDEGVKAEIEKHGLELLGVLPQDEGVYRCDCDGQPSAKLPSSNPVKLALKDIMKSIGL
jgi:CO dehydrogenase maturation factor